jgi:hypothetical protein
MISVKNLNDRDRLRHDLLLVLLANSKDVLGND